MQKSIKKSKFKKFYFKLSTKIIHLLTKGVRKND